MKKNKIALIIVFTMLLSGCGTSEEAVRTSETSAAPKTSAETTVTVTEASTDTAVTAESTTDVQTTIVTETTTELTTEQTTIAETTVTEETTTAFSETTPETTTTVTTAQTTITESETTTEITERTTVTEAVTTAPEITVEITTTAEPPEVIPENGIYTAKDGTLYVDGEAYSLTFEDDFEGNELDFSKWEYCPEWQRQNFNCYWRNSQVSVADGKLEIESRYYLGDYLMGGIRSKGKFEQAYGYFEARCTLNTIPGYWSAFWLMSEEVGIENNSGTDGTEIDIMESAYFGTAVNHALNWDGYGEAHKAKWFKTEKEGLYDGGFHTFSLLWTKDEYVFYVDGEECHRTKAEEAGGVSTTPSYLKFTTETGYWTNNELNPKSFPDSVYLDYVRVYKKSE